MRAVHAVVGGVLDLLLLPFRGLDPVWGLLFVSLATGLLFLYVFKWTSNQEAIRRAKSEVKAHLLEMRLFRHDPVLSLRAFGDILVSNLRYLAHSLRPMVVLLVPAVLILVQLHARYEWRPLRTGEETLLRVTLPADSRPGKEARLLPSRGFTATSPALRIPTLAETDWRLRATSTGEHEILVSVGGREIRKKVRVGGALPALAETRGRGFWAALLEPAEPSLPRDGPAASVAVEYTARRIAVFGWRVHWLVFFLLASIIPAYLLKGLFGVEA